MLRSWCYYSIMHQKALAIQIIVQMPFRDQNQLYLKKKKILRRRQNWGGKKTLCQQILHKHTKACVHNETHDLKKNISWRL